MPEDAATRLQFDEVYHVASLEDKVKYIQSIMQQGSVLVYGAAELNEALIAAGIETVLMNEAIDFAMLRHLDNAPYKVLVSLD